MFSAPSLLSQIVMTVHLNSDVPVPYGSWDEYPVMKPVGPKEASPLAAVFISNCGGHNNRIKASNPRCRLVTHKAAHIACVLPMHLCAANVPVCCQCSCVLLCVVPMCP